MEYKILFNGRSHNYTEEEIALVAEIMRHADTFTQGKYLKEFEAKLSEYLSAPYVFGISNATCALETVAKLLFIKEGDEIIAPAHTYTSSVYPFIKCGARIRFADIDLDTRVITVKEIERYFTDKTIAVIVPHLYGYVAGIDEICEFAYLKGIKVIEDCAQSFGASLNGKKCGTWGSFGVYSFHSQKNITTLGEGGALAIRDKELAELVPMLRHNGHRAYTGIERLQSGNKYWLPAMTNVVMPSYKGMYIFPDNFCIDEVKCALGSKLIDRVDDINFKRRSIAVHFIDEVNSFSDGKLIFHREESQRHCYHLLVARVNGIDRNVIMKKLAEKYDIQCVIQYQPLYRYDFYQYFGYKPSLLTNNSEKFYDTMISFPFYEAMFDKISYIIDSLKEVLKGEGDVKIESSMEEGVWP